MATTTIGAGTFPSAGFAYVADQGTNQVEIEGNGIRLKTTVPIDVKTTYSIVPMAAWAGFDAGWHYHNGPVIVSVTVGTLTFFNKTCGTRDVHAGQAYIERTGKVLDAKIVASKQTVNTTVEWFTTRLYPHGATDPVPVTAPCTP